MDIDKVIAENREMLGAGKVFGEPIRQNGITIVPVAKIGGGGGGGVDESGDGGGGAGFGISARPAGALVIRDDGSVSWKVPFDLNKVIMGWQIVMVSLIVAVCFVQRARARAVSRAAIASSAIGKTAELVARRHAE